VAVAVQRRRRWSTDRDVLEVKTHDRRSGAVALREQAKTDDDRTSAWAGVVVGVPSVNVSDGRALEYFGAVDVLDLRYFACRLECD
jgi:hypothetical protein